MYEVIKSIYKGNERFDFHICFVNSFFEAIEEENKQIEAFGREEYLKSKTIWFHSQEVF